MENDFLIEVKNLSKAYNIDGEEFLALDNVSFTLGRNESIGLIGKNGSGKSTLLKILSGLIKPSSGTAIINGKINSLIEIGSNFIPDLSGRENVKQFLELNNISKDKIDAIIEEVKDFSELNHFFEKPVKFYSSGMFVRLAISSGFHIDADIFLIDEVLMAGDAEFREKVSQKFNELTDSGCAIILASHSIEEIMNNTKQCLWINRGAVVEKKPTVEVLNDFMQQKTKKIVNDNIALVERYKKLNNNFIYNIKQIEFLSENEWVDVLDFEILNPNKINYSSGFSLLIRFKSKKEGEQFFPSIKISDKLSQSFAGLISPNSKDLRSQIIKNKVTNNTFTFQCTVPGKIFSPGIFYLTLKINTINQFNNQHLNDLYTFPINLCFQITEDDAIQYTNSILSDMQVAPECTWKLQ